MNEPKEYLDALYEQAQETYEADDIRAIENRVYECREYLIALRKVQCKDADFSIELDSYFEDLEALASDLIDKIDALADEAVERDDDERNMALMKNK